MQCVSSLVKSESLLLRSCFSPVVVVVGVVVVVVVVVVLVVVG